MLRDLTAALEDDGLDYPVPAVAFTEPSKFPEGKTYRVKAPDVKTGLWLTSISDVGVAAAVGMRPASAAELDDDEERHLYQRILGAAHDEMVADGLCWPALTRIAQDAFLSFVFGGDAADQVLGRLGNPPARPNRATRRTRAKKVGSKSSPASSDTPAPTPSPASTPSSKTPAAPEAQAI